MGKHKQYFTMKTAFQLKTLQKSIRTQNPTINTPNGNFKDLSRVSSRLMASWLT